MHQDRHFKAPTYMMVFNMILVQGPANAEVFKGLLMLHHCGPDSMGTDASGTKL